LKRSESALKRSESALKRLKKWFWDTKK
jgi:hypothetical protein